MHQIKLFFLYLIVNAYEENGYIILDAPFGFDEINYDSLKFSFIGGSVDQMKENMIKFEPAAGPCLRFALPLTMPTFQGMEITASKIRLENVKEKDNKNAFFCRLGPPQKIVNDDNSMFT